MRRTLSALLVGSALLAGAATLYVSNSGASFSGASPPATSVAIYTPDGGPLRVGVDDSVRLDVAATTAPGTYLAVAGDSTGTILRTNLGTASLNTLLHPECTQGRPELLQLGITPRQVPVADGHADPATAWRLTNLSNNRLVCCLPSLDGGVPPVTCDVPTDGGVAYSYVAPPDYGSLEITGEGFTHSVWCRVEGSNPLVFAPVNVWEDSCIQP